MCSKTYANVAEIILDKQVGPTSTIQGIQIKSETGTSGEVQIAEHACEEGHRVCWNAARTLQLQLNGRYKKNKESAHMACLEKTIGHLSCDFPRIWCPLISKTVRKQLHTHTHTHTHMCIKGSLLQ